MCFFFVCFVSKCTGQGAQASPYPYLWRPRGWAPETNRLPGYSPNLRLGWVFDTLLAETTQSCKGKTGNDPLSRTSTSPPVKGALRFHSHSASESTTKRQYAQLLKHPSKLQRQQLLLEDLKQKCLQKPWKHTGEEKTCNCPKPIPRLHAGKIPMHHLCFKKKCFCPVTDCQRFIYNSKAY